MENGYCIPKNDLYALLEQRQKAMLNRVMAQFPRLTSQEMVAQMEREEGEFNEAVKAERLAFAKKTSNVEIVLAFQLADFYFPDLNPEICFEMRRGFSANNDVSYDSVVAGIENDTAIDCAIRADGRGFNFQIKRYPQEYLAHTREAIAAYIKKTLTGYGDMKGAILVLLLQPNTEAPNDLNFRQVHEDMLAMEDKISFDEIDLVFNNRMQTMRWQQVFPECGHYDKPLELSSDKYKAQQEEWKQKTA